MPVRGNKRMSAVFAILAFGAALAALAALPSGAASADAPAASAAPASSSGGSIWGASYFPDVPLTTHQGKRVRFFSDLIKDKVVVINFIYTSCPDECALETARLAEVQKIMGERVGKDVFIYSITIDPDRDTPRLLKEYAEKFEAGPGWLFLTGKDADITQLRQKLGLYSAGDKDGKLQDHNLSLIIGNQKTGQWMRVSPHENPYIMATQVGSWLHNWKKPARADMSYADAPKIRNISAGETLYRTRCAACHKIGAQTTAGSPDLHPIGPDLMDITKRRDPKWLTRWLMEPDKMLAEKDPLAIELLARFNNLPMPNMRLDRKDTQALFDYLDEESRRINHLQHGKGAQDHEGHQLQETSAH
jgi:protein SCO1